MIAYEHLCQVVEKLSILLIRTDRGIYKKKNIDRRNNIIAKSTTLSAFQKNRKSAIVPSINLSYLNQPKDENPTQRPGHAFKTLHDEGPTFFNPRYIDDDDVAQSVCTDMVNIRGQDGEHGDRSHFTSPLKPQVCASIAFVKRGGFSAHMSQLDAEPDISDGGDQPSTTKLIEKFMNMYQELETRLERGI